MEYKNLNLYIAITSEVDTNTLYLHYLFTLFSLGHPGGN